MSRLCLILAALACAAPANAQSVEVASGDWYNIPRLESAQRTRISTKSVDRVVNIVKSGTCALPGQSKDRIDMAVPFLIQFEPDGDPTRIVIARMNCPELESLMGGVVLNLARAGEFKPTGENQTGWYRSELSFAVQ